MSFHGRAAERDLVAALVDRARASRSGVLVVRGAAGVGKSALLEECARRHAGVRALWARGVESESELAFAALHQLLRPVLGLTDRLPGHQARALRTALGLEPPESGDRFLVALALLGLLAEAAEAEPVLCLVDDAHWLDAASAAALLFVARRLTAERVALLFAVRDDEAASGVVAAGLPGLRLGGLDRESAAALLADQSGAPVDPAVCELLWQQTGGNPLAMVELPAVLTRDQLAGRAPLPAPLPLPAGLAQMYAERVNRLAAPARTALLVAAAEETGRLATVAAAGAALGAPVGELDEAERAGLVRIGEGEVRFAHPLVRLAVYQSAPAGQRRAAHRALAAVLAGAGSEEAAAWQLAAATVEPDEAVAGALAKAAERARARGGFEAAGAALARAAELTAEPVVRAGRTLAAAENAWRAGQFVRAAVLLDGARPPPTEPLLRAATGQLRGWLELSFGSVDVAEQTLVQAARDAATADARLARSVLAAAAEAAWLNISPRTDELRQVAATLPAPHDSIDRHLDQILQGFLRLLDDEPAAGVDLLAGAIRQAERLGEPGLLTLAAHHALYLGADDAAQRVNTALVGAARSLGAAADLQFALSRLAHAELLTGRWTAAAANAEEAVRLAKAIGQPALTAFPLAWLALLAALRGDEAELWARIGEIDEVSADQPLGIFRAPIDEVMRWVRAVHSGTNGRHASAVAMLETLTHPVIRLSAATDRIETAVRAGRREQAQRWLAELAAFAEHSGAAWARAAVEYGHGLLSEGHVAAGRFTAALAWHEQAQRPFDRARAELAYGELLRRARRRGEARVHLAAALQVFEDLSAGPWVERAGTELRACGQTPRRRDPSTLRQLTPQEVQVARFVARGLPNREVAAQLFLSPRTVDFHLRNVFAKLGISSRTELARLRLE